MGAVTSNPGLAASTALGAGGFTVPLAAAQKLGGGKLGQRGPLSGMIGQGGGAAGTGFAAPEAANIQQGTNVADVQGAQAGAANSLASQQALLAALQGQNGLGQQNAVAQQQNALNSQLNAANGIGTQNAAIQGLQGAAGMYGNIAQGRGPNPAQAALNQNTGQNVANQAALMAGQRGAGSNVGLMARQAAQQGAATQQQAVGQGATLQAQQQIAGLQGLTGANQAMGGLGTSQLAAQQAQQAALANQANLVAGQQIAGTTANTQANLANQQQMQGALQGINQSNVANQGNINTANAGLAQTQLGNQAQVMGGLGQGIGAVAGLMAKGGEVKMADGGDAQVPLVQPVSSQQFFQAGPQAAGPTSAFGQFMSGWESSPTNTGDEAAAQADRDEKDKKSMKADNSPPLTKGVSSMIKGIGGAAMAAKGGLASSGGHVKAKDASQKAVKGGDSYSNDKVPAKLSEGEIVIPRSVTMGKDPIGGSAEFVRKVLAKRGAK